MQKQINEIKQELGQLIKCIRTRLEYEKIFGISSIKSNLSTPSKRNPNKPRTIPTLADVKTDPLTDLRKEALQCELCELSKTRNNVVFGEGNLNADLMFIGEAPGYYEDVKGEPFVGKAGELLTKIINAIDLKREDVYIANILKCRPPENRDPNAREINLCYPYLKKQIDLIKPKIICALGTFAIQTLLQSTESIGRLRGIFHDFHGTKLLATYHPAYLLRTPSAKKKTWIDIQKVRDFLKANQ
ncbi:MAG: uracil-DNA glycosylase [Candidatus Anammoxibacter sp.]